MRLGFVRGHIVLGQAIPALRGARLLVVEPITAASLASANGAGGGKCLIVADQLAPHVGQRIAFVEGREAANPYWPDSAPVDAYCAMIVDRTDFRPPETHAAPAGREVQR